MRYLQSKLPFRWVKCSEFYYKDLQYVPFWMIVRSVVIELILTYLHEIKGVMTGRIVLKDLLTLPLRIILLPLGILFTSYDLYKSKDKYRYEGSEKGYSLTYTQDFTLYMVDKDLLKHSKVSAWNHQEDHK